MNNNHFLFIYFLICIKFAFIYPKIYDVYQLQRIDGEDGNILLDVVDYHILKLIVTGAGTLYTGILPTKKSQINEI